jgi:putative transposase
MTPSGGCRRARQNARRLTEAALQSGNWQIAIRMRPPRISNFLPDDIPTVYFMTLCVRNRDRVLDNPETWQAILRALQRLDRWLVLGAVAMPDHLHVLAGPCKERDESVTAMIRWFKTWLRQDLGHKWSWQEGGFDRLLRGGDSAEQKWHYMCQNPVRAGLVQNAEDWPFQTCTPPTRL